MKQKQIESWLSQGIISQDQADKMLLDLESQKEQTRRKRFLATIYTIGSLLVGIGVILFIAANNWILELFSSDLLKICALAGLTIGSYYSGYFLKYEKQMPRVGAALIFLSALLIGGTYCLIGQIYNVQANSSGLVLMWLLSILPLVYIHKSVSVGVLSSILFTLWNILFFWVEDHSAYRCEIVLLMISGLFLFNLGSLHQFSEKLLSIGRVYRLSGLLLTMGNLYVFTFFSFNEWGYYYDFKVALDPVFLTFLILTVIFSLLMHYHNPQKSDSSHIESIISLVIGIVAIAWMFSGGANPYYLTALSNIVYVAVLSCLYYFGYKREDLKLVNISTFFLTIFLLARYFEYSWEFLPKSLFFVIGGLTLLGGGIYIEKKKGEIKVKLAEKN